VLGEDIEQQEEKGGDDNQALRMEKSDEEICDFSGETKTSTSKDSGNNPSKLLQFHLCC
jgi:hypothetical protein